MRLNNYTNKDYTLNSNVYQLKLPLELDGLVPNDDSVRLLSQVLEELDYTKLYQAYSTRGRNPVVDPKTMFKVLVYAYSQNIYSTHKIETACKRDINFMWLLSGQKAPDHSTIARFRQNHVGAAIEDLFYQMANLLFELGEIKYENVFIDGTKIEANANKYTFVWKKAVMKNEAKMHLKIKELLDVINHDYIQAFTFSEETALADLLSVLTFLESKCKEADIVFVHGKGKRPCSLQKHYEAISEYYNRQETYNHHKDFFSGRNSFSKTDNDATFMHMKEDHMRNSQLKPGYNLQIGVEAEYITGVGVFSERNDHGTLKPMLTNMKEMSGHKYKNVIADAGYESEEGYLYLEEEQQTPYIKPQTYEKWKKRSFKNDISKRENMTYNTENDYYICHNKKKLIATGTRVQTTTNGYKTEQTIYVCEDCRECPYKTKCTKAAGNRKMYVSKQFIEKRQVSYNNIISKMGIKLRVNRSIQVEGAFGVLKGDYKFTRFLTRGKNNVKTEFLFLCFGYNINKLHSKIQNNRTGIQLHEIKESA